MSTDPAAVPLLKPAVRLCGHSMLKNITYDAPETDKKQSQKEDSHQHCYCRFRPPRRCNAVHVVARVSATASEEEGAHGHDNQAYDDELPARLVLRHLLVASPAPYRTTGS